MMWMHLSIYALLPVLLLCSPVPSGLTREELAFALCNNQTRPCSNHGICVTARPESLDAFECRCEEGFEGLRCERRVNYCTQGDTEFCFNDGKCIHDQDKGTACRCLEGFGGDRCDREFDLCAPDENYCQNGGSCALNKCSCLEGFKGSHCEVVMPASANSTNFEGNVQSQSSSWWGILVSGCVFVLIITFLVAMIITGRKRYSTRDQPGLIRLFGTDLKTATCPAVHDTSKEGSDQGLSNSNLGLDTILKAVCTNKTKVVKEALVFTRNWCKTNHQEFAPFVNAIDSSGLTPLIRAVLFNNIAVVHELLATEECDVYATNNRGQNALMVAAQANLSTNHIVRMLLTYMLQHPLNAEQKSPRNKADYTRIEVSCRTSLDFRVCTDVFGRSPMHYAAMNGNQSLIGELVIQGFNVNARCNFDETPIYYAIREGHYAVVKMLIDLGAKHKMSNASGFTPQQIAERYGCPDILEAADVHATN
ncbi:hypothetical protein L596_014098 [Steinernema carpocapsae]|uniref:EGF-like domain-containing protein n=1 Tax=Steinernema carpocapsae TaxID=34508 RepID=A0A4U5NBR1_STECR|nr:hypothetical protein L596_014098 [Steinernema carpocapsae]